MSLGWNVAWNYGRLNQFGFATTLTGWEQQPSISFGHVFAHTAVTFRADLYVTSVLYITEDKNTLTTANSFINGYSFSANFEQKLYKNRAINFGLANGLYTVSYYCLAGISCEWKKILDARVQSWYKLITEIINDYDFRHTYKYLILLFIFFSCSRNQTTLQPPIDLGNVSFISYTQ